MCGIYVQTVNPSWFFPCELARKKYFPSNNLILKQLVQLQIPFEFESRNKKLYCFWIYLITTAALVLNTQKYKFQATKILDLLSNLEYLVNLLDTGPHVCFFSKQKSFCVKFLINVLFWDILEYVNCDWYSTQYQLASSSLLFGHRYLDSYYYYYYFFPLMIYFSISMPIYSRVFQKFV